MSASFRAGDRVRLVRLDGLNGLEGTVVDVGVVYRRVTLDARPGRYWRFLDCEMEHLT